MMSLVMSTINAALKRILVWAKADRDPQIYATVFIDETPQWIANYLTPQQTLEYLNHSQWFEKVCEINAELKPYQEWCEEFRQELIEVISQTIEQNETEAGAIEEPKDD